MNENHITERFEKHSIDRSQPDVIFREEKYEKDTSVLNLLPIFKKKKIYMQNGNFPIYRYLKAKTAHEKKTEGRGNLFLFRRLFMHLLLETNFFFTSIDRKIAK